MPQESVFEKAGKKIVYLKNGSGFDEQNVETGEKSENYVVITKGIKNNDVVALMDPNAKLDEIDNQSDKSKSVNYPSSVK